jgi:uracil-DNA glycosylase family 4
MPTDDAQPKPAAYLKIKDMTREQRWEEYARRRLVPVDHPALPGPGPDFARTASDLCAVKVTPHMARDSPPEVALDFLYRNALYMREWQLQVNFKGEFHAVKFLPGGLWDLPEAYDHVSSSHDVYDHQWDGYVRVNGPRRRANVMLIGKHPGSEELDYEQNFIGPASASLHVALREIGVTAEVRRSWYVTNTVKHNRLDPTSTNMQQSWLKNCAPLLWEEIFLVRPRFIACLGTEAIKAVLGKGYNVANMAGRVVELTLRVPPPDAEAHAEYDDLDGYVDHKVQVMGIAHPAYVFHRPEAYPAVRDGMEKFVKLVGGETPPNAEDRIDHTPYYTAPHPGRVVDDILEQAHHEWDFEADGDLPVAWDAEWHGHQPHEAGSYLRTVQFAAAGSSYEEPPQKATCLVLTEKGGGTGWFRSREEVAGVIQRLVDGRHSDGKLTVRTRHGGHFFKADIPWIRAFTGVDFRSVWVPPPPQPPPEEGEVEKPATLRFDGRLYRCDLAAWEADKAKAARDAEAAAKAGRPAPPPFKDPPPDRRAKKYMKMHWPWELTRYEGGFDTGYMTHAVFEAVESFSLEQLALRWTTCPRWDIDVEKAKVRIAKELGIKVRDLSGYGDIPDHEIMPYALYDADATLRLFWKFNFARAEHDGYGFLDFDVNRESSREPFWRTMLAGLAFLEMEETGVTVDVARGKELIKVFEQVKETLTASLRADLDWPEFNPNSAPQVRAWMFGEQYGRLIDRKTGKPRNLLPRPEAEMCRGLEPIKTTSKPARPWSQIKDRGETKAYTPAVDKEVLGIYAWEDDQVKKLRDIRYVRQVLQSVLRPPKIGEAIGADQDGMVFDEQDEFDGGFLSYVSPKDSRVRSRFYPVETGRCSSAGPNQQNLAKKREDDYARILGHYVDGQPEGDYLNILGPPLYRDPIRSIITAGLWDGEPTVLIEFDIKSAEIAALAWEAGDEQMIEDVNRAMLDEDDPDFLDLHSATAVEAFKLTCAPTKKALKGLGKPGLRVAAKNVRFGVPYGRSAAALVRQCREEGAAVTVKECQRLIDNYHRRYPWASDFLAACEARPAGDRPYIIGAFGRIRRFQRVEDQSALADQGRSAKNYPIQNLVADAILLGMYNLQRAREAEGLQHAFRIVLQIHDAVMLEVKVPYIETVRAVAMKALGKDVPVTPRTINGLKFSDIGTERDLEKEGKDPKVARLYRAKPYEFKVDCSVFLNWGQAIDPARAAALGIPGKYLGGE